MDADIQRTKLLNLNRVQTWLIVFGTSISILTTLTALANGWLGLPDKVSKIAAKVEAQNDLLITINQKVADMQGEQQQLRQDVNKHSRK